MRKKKPNRHEEQLVITDLTERKRAEMELRRVNRALRTISDCNQALVRATEEPVLLKDICEILVRVGGYRMAWVGFAEHDDGKSVRPVAHTGFEDGYLETANITWADTERGQGPTGKTVRTGKPTVVRFIQADPSLAPWREEALKRGYASSIALPIRLNNNVVGALTAYAEEPDAFDSAEVQLLAGLAGDLAYGIQTLRAKIERKAAEEGLRESEVRYRTLVENIPQRIFMKSRDHRFVSVNESFARSIGLRPESIVGKLDYDLFPKELADKYCADDKRIMETGVTDEYDEEYLEGNERRIVHTIKTPVKEESGTVLGVLGVFWDVTDRKRAEEALRESEERFRSLVENATVGIYRTTPDGRILMANPTLITMLGYPDFAALAARNLEEEGFEPGYSRREFRERIERDGEVNGLEEKWKRANGSVIFIRESARAVRGEDGTVLYYDGIVEDITERKRAEEARRRGEACLAAGESLTHTGSWSWNVTTGELFWSQETYRIFGFDPTKDKASIRDTFLARIHPEDRARVEAGLRNPDAQVDVEYRIVLPDGSIRHVQDIAYPVTDATGETVERFGVACDITERKRAEEEHIRLVTAIEQSAEAVVITNTQGDIEYVNPAFTRVTGYSREEVMGKNPRILKSEKQDLEFYQELWATILKGQPWHGELINRRKDGSLYTEQMNITPVRGARGEVTHFIATKQDVTERKSLEGQLHQSAKIEAVGRLAGGVAHDFNNLLTVINGYSELLWENIGGDTKSSIFIKEILDAGQRAASLTRQLLAFSRRQVLAPQVLDLNKVVSNLGNMLRRLIGEDIKLHTLLDPSLHRVMADPGQIEQVIMNLAVNARDAMPQGGGLTIETSNVELDEAYASSHPTVVPGPHVMLAVADTGVGMTPETMARIFEPFFTTKEMGKGTGLGLASVYGIVKQSGGSIWVYSEPGQGTVFKVYFPMVMESLAPAEQAKVETGLDGGTETILVVEDEEGVRSLIHQALASSGYRVLDTEGAKGALVTCARYNGPIHLLLTDVVMPQMSGPVMASKVAALRPGIRVLYMSGYTDDAVVRHGILTQDTPFLQKPFSPAALRKKIREVLGGK